LINLKIPYHYVFIFTLLLIVGGVYGYNSVSRSFSKTESKTKELKKRMEFYHKKADSLRIQREVLKAEYDSIQKDYKHLQDSLKVDYKHHVESYKAIELTPELWDKYYKEL